MLFLLFQVFPKIFPKVQSKLPEKCWQPTGYAKVSGKFFLHKIQNVHGLFEKLGKSVG